jgi:hypothetical protein
MKSIIQYLLIAILTISTLTIQEVQARKSKTESVLSDKLQIKINEKVARHY